MARKRYATSGGDVGMTVNPTTGVISLPITSSATFPVFSEYAGGTQITDLSLDEAGSNVITAVPVPTVSSPQSVFYLPETYTGSVYLQDANGRRWRVDPDDVADHPEAPVWGSISGQPSTYPPSEHTHDGLYYTKTQLDDPATGKAAVLHDHLAEDITDLSDAIALLIPTSDSTEPDMYVVRGTDGSFPVPPALADDRPVPLAQVRALIGTGTGTGGLAGSAPKAPASILPLSSTTDGTYTTLNTLVGLRVTGAKSGERYRMPLWIAYRAVTAAGIALRIKTAGTSTTNRIANPAAETDVSGYTASTGTLTRDTATKFSGAASFKYVHVSGTNATITSDWYDVGSAAAFSAAAQVIRSTSTGRSVAVDVQYADSTAINGNATTGVLGANNGPGVTVPQTWTRVIRDSSTTTISQPGAFPGATKVRWRMRIINAVAGDTFYFDEVQLEPTDPIPTFGNAGGGTSSLAVQGELLALPPSGAVTATTPRVPTFLRHPTVTGLGVTAQGLGTSTDAAISGHLDIEVGGTGLADQVIEFEWAQMAANATATQIVAAHGSVIKVAG